MQQYLYDALQCGEVVWHYGLLKKGYGLCHGAAGNAYTFLALYRHTQDPKHLYRACMVSELERDWLMPSIHHSHGTAAIKELRRMSGAACAVQRCSFIHPSLLCKPMSAILFEDLTSYSFQDVVRGNERLQ